MVDINAILDSFRGISAGHPYLALAVLLFIIGALIRGKTALIFYFLGFMALLQEFSLFGTFVDFLKGLPDKIGSLLSIIGGV